VITYTQWLNEAGLLEADLTVTKLREDEFLVVASDTAHRHVETWMRRHQPADAHAFVSDVTSGLAQLNVQGPRSRELLQSVTHADLSNEAFPFRAAREIDIGFARVLCVRITYLGELGYELYIPTEQALHVHDRLVEAGAGVGLRHAGLKALASLRMEKAYRDYGHDIDNTDSVLEAGLGFAVNLDKPGGFIGREAVLAQKAAGLLKRRLVQVLVKDPGPMMYHAEIVYRDGRPVGYVRAASYGHTLGGAVGLAMVQADEPVDVAWLDRGSWEVDIAGRRYPAVASLRPLYDPAPSSRQLVVGGDEAREVVLELAHRRSVHIHHVPGLVVLDRHVGAHVGRHVQVLHRVLGRAVGTGQVEVTGLHQHLHARVQRHRMRQVHRGVGIGHLPAAARLRMALVPVPVQAA
jgi:4-methylaminobutanoate oxidase (formaldehyde-forming)